MPRPKELVLELGLSNPYGRQVVVQRVPQYNSVSITGTLTINGYVSAQGPLENEKLKVTFCHGYVHTLCVCMAACEQKAICAPEVYLSYRD